MISRSMNSRHVHRASRLLPALALAGIGSCTPTGLSTAPLCPDLLPGSVAIVPRDSVSGALLSDSAQGVAVSVSRTEALRRGPQGIYGDSVLIGGSGRGPFNVQITRPGYRPWETPTVTARFVEAECSYYVPTVITARMQRSGG